MHQPEGHGTLLLACCASACSLARQEGSVAASDHWLLSAMYFHGLSTACAHQHDICCPRQLLVASMRLSFDCSASLYHMLCCIVACNDVSDAHCVLTASFHELGKIASHTTEHHCLHLCVSMLILARPHLACVLLAHFLQGYCTCSLVTWVLLNSTPQGSPSNSAS